MLAPECSTVGLVGMTWDEGQEVIALLLPMGYKWQPCNHGRALAPGVDQRAGDLLDPKGEQCGEFWSGKLWLPARTIAVALPLLLAKVREAKALTGELERQGRLGIIDNTAEVLAKDLPSQLGDDEPVNSEPNGPTWGQVFGRGREAKP